MLNIAGRTIMGDLPLGRGQLPGGCRCTRLLQATPRLGLKAPQTSFMALPLGTHNSAPSILAVGRSHRPTLGTNMMHSGQASSRPSALYCTTLFLSSNLNIYCSFITVMLMAAVQISCNYFMKKLSVIQIEDILQQLSYFLINHNDLSLYGICLQLVWLAFNFACHLITKLSQYHRFSTPYSFCMQI